MIVVNLVLYIGFNYDDSVEYLRKIALKKEHTITSHSMIHSETANNKNYNINFIGTTANVGFRITIQNKNITRVMESYVLKINIQ